MEAYHVGVAIVNYKTADLVCECLESIACLNANAKISVCVVDNASGDGSLDKLQSYVRSERFSGWVYILDGKRNGGFSYGNNRAAEYFEKIGITHFWLLNPDANPKSDALLELLNVLDRHEGCAMVGSRLQDEDGTEQVAAFNFPTPFGEFVNTLKLNLVSKVFTKRVIAQPLETIVQEVDWVAGASMLIRWSDFEKVGFMDEGYFLYFEEVDLCMAVRSCGRSIMYVPQSRVVHHVGAATGISDTRKQAPRRPRYWFESRRRFYIKNYGVLCAILADMFWLVGFSLYRLKALLMRKPRLDPPYFAWDFLKNSVFFRGGRL